MRFVDEVSIYIQSGKGGDGAVSFLRQRFKPRGGPDGGNGGHGGSVVFVADPQLGTLLDYRFQQHHRGQDGENGRSRQCYGKNGLDCELRVPVGTVVSDHDTGELLADLSTPSAQFIAARGGRGGRGNMHFASSTNQAPRHAEPGGEAESRRVRLTLKLLADVGLVGHPNAGKSTLISRVSAARPKIAEYPFTTLVPNLGMVRTGREHSFVVADIPGLIAGASEGAGLGIRFLKHVERVSVLAFLVCVSPGEENRDPVADYHTLVRELGAYSGELLEKPRMIVLTKADLPDTLEAEPQVRALAEAEGVPFFCISAVRGDGLDGLCYAMQGAVDRHKAELRAQEAETQGEATGAAKDEAEDTPGADSSA